MHWELYRTLNLSFQVPQHSTFVLVQIVQASLCFAGGLAGTRRPPERGGTPYLLPTYTLHPTPYILHSTPYILHSTPYTLHPTPCTLHPTPYTLHPTPNTPHPTPQNPNPKHYTSNSGRSTLSPSP